MDCYSYLEVELVPGAKSVTELYDLKQILDKSLKTLFGEIGASYPVDILKFDPKKSFCILRCLLVHSVRVRAALTLSNQFENIVTHEHIRMSYCRKDGKDIIIFATAEDHKTPSKVTLPDPEPSTGLILPNGEINWNCPCLGGMATGPCGLEFREAFSCFHNSTAEPKGQECYDAFREMHLCMAEYPELYNKDDDDDNDFSKQVDGSSQEITEAVQPVGKTT